MHGVPPDWVTLCQAVGARAPWWTQGAGGNVSVKSADALFIKASGHRLDAAGPGRAVARLPLKAFVTQLAESNLTEADYALTLRTCSDPAGGRASMESGFHALLPERVVIHFHPVSALVMAHAARTTPQAWQDFCVAQQRFSARVIAPTPPGLALSRAIAQHPRCDMFLLENHGIVVQGPNTAILDGWAKFEAAFCAAWHAPGAMCDTPLDEAALAAGPWRAYTPDAVVFADRVRALVTRGAGAASATDEAGFTDAEEYRLIADARARDRCAWEIWVAMQLAHRACPQLARWPASMTETLHTLPGEVFRRQCAGRCDAVQGDRAP